MVVAVQQCTAVAEAAAYDNVWKQWLLRQWQRGDCDPLVAAQTEPVIQPATAGGALLWRAHAKLVF